jgi:hypothetical protein
MVDELQIWPHARHRCFLKGSAHLTCDGDLDELHAFAQSIGLRRSWFQPHISAPHYDLSPGRRDAAIAAGAVFVSARDQALERRRKRLAAAADVKAVP